MARVPTGNSLNKLELWTVFILAAIATFGLRFLPINFLENRRLAPWLERALRYVPAATLAGLVFPALLLQSGKLALSINNDRLIAGIVAALIAYFTKNTLLTIILGLVALWLLQRI
jgi:branched-subunit amino acid transport protein